MRWTRAATEMRVETVAEIIDADPTRSLKQIRYILEVDHGIRVSRETIRVDTNRLGMQRRWVRLPDNARSPAEDDGEA